jgi:hypothetical protein
VADGGFTGVIFIHKWIAALRPIIQSLGYDISNGPRTKH